MSNIYAVLCKKVSMESFFRRKNTPFDLEMRLHLQKKQNEDEEKSHAKKGKQYNRIFPIDFSIGILYRITSDLGRRNVARRFVTVEAAIPVCIYCGYDADNVHSL